MLIDILFLLVFLHALLKGYREGFIMGLFSFVGIFVGLAAALKLSATVANWLQDSGSISVRWLPVLSFLVVFFAALIMVRIGASVLEKIAEAMFLGIVNKLAGILLFLLLNTVVFSVLLFYLVQMGIIGEKTILLSKTYPWVSPVGPWLIDRLGTIIPLFKDIFSGLQQFFDGFSELPAATENTGLL